MDNKFFLSMQKEIEELERQLAEKKEQLEKAKSALHNQTAAKKTSPENLFPDSLPFADNQSSPEIKIALFRSLFRGREDVYAKRFESKKTGKAGYQPVCRNEWVRGICGKPTAKCGVCAHRAFEKVTDAVIKNHLSGFIPAVNENGIPLPFVMGVYPLLQNETCHFLAIDFDKTTWQEDAKAFLESCGLDGIPSALEISRSGNGAHVWIFFAKPVPAAKARKLGSYLMTRTLDRRPEIGLDSFDRFFPNQDTLPKGGFGSLIALPLQKAAREKNHSIFIDENAVPYSDQWAFLSSVSRLDEGKIDTLIQNAVQHNELLPVIYDPAEVEDEAKPWQRRTEVFPAIVEPLPEKTEIILADQLYIDHTGLPPVIRNRILRLASFANPEFYRAQRMRLPTWDKPHILYCYEYFPKYIGLPAGCLDGLMAILEHYHIKPELRDKQNRGFSIDVRFQGELRDTQKEAARKLMLHQTGILSASTAFGKTVTALWIIAERKVNTIILVHRKLLADQWAERIHDFLGIPKKEIGYYSGTKKKRTGIIDIAVMQSVVRKDKVEDWIGEYGQLVVDECHHISAASFERIIRKCPARYRLGLSATVIRKDGQHPIVLMNLGEVRFVDNRANAVPSFTRKMFQRFTEFDIEGKQDENEVSIVLQPMGVSNKSIQDIFHKLCICEERNKLIVEDVLNAHREGRECLVLSERLEHLDILRDALWEHASNIFTLRGGLGKKQLKTIMEAMRNIPPHEHRIILATGKYLGEGFDLPNLDTLFLAFPFSWKGMLTQYTGRLNRDYHGKKEVRVYDYIDDNVPVLAGMYKKRLNGYKGLGFEVTRPGFSTAR